MRDYLSIGSSPFDEDCAQVGSENYYERSKKECRAFINQIRRVLGQEPFGARLSIKANPHDFGTYHEVVCYYDDNIPESEEYAFLCESDAPEFWDEEAKQGKRNQYSYSPETFRGNLSHS